MRMMKTQTENVMDNPDAYQLTRVFRMESFSSFAYLGSAEVTTPVSVICGSVPCWLRNVRESHVSICWTRTDTGVKTVNIIGV